MQFTMVVSKYIIETSLNNSGRRAMVTIYFVPIL